MVKTRRAQTNDLAWIRTDADGQIESLSHSATELLGLPRAGGQNLLIFFPVDRRAMAFDMEVALTGWPSRRMATLESLTSRRLLVRYTVTAGVAPDVVGLYWFFEVLGTVAPQFLH